MADGEILEEGPRSAMRFLETVGHGQLAFDLSRELQSIGKVLRDKWVDLGEGCKAELHVKVLFKSDETGVCKVGYEIKAKVPSEKTPASIFWTTAGGNFSTENPKQPDLPGIREVPAPKQEVRELNPQQETRGA